MDRSSSATRAYGLTMEKFSRRALACLFLLFVVQVNGFSKYGRTCQDINCPSQQICTIIEECDSAGQKCGYPTCVRSKTTSLSCETKYCGGGQHCVYKNGAPECIDDKPISVNGPDGEVRWLVRRPGVYNNKQKGSNPKLNDVRERPRYTPHVRPSVRRTPGTNYYNTHESVNPNVELYPPVLDIFAENNGGEFRDVYRRQNTDDVESSSGIKTSGGSGYPAPSSSGYPSYPGNAAAKTSAANVGSGYPSSSGSGYPSSSGSGYPSSSGSSYPKSSGYPSSSGSGYPSSSGSGYPSSSGSGYPSSSSSGYPSSSGSGYPSSSGSGYPSSTSSGYPSSSASGYPRTSGYPSSSGSGYPSNSGYPSSGSSGYPSRASGYPASGGTDDSIRRTSATSVNAGYPSAGSGYPNPGYQSNSGYPSQYQGQSAGGGYPGQTGGGYPTSGGYQGQYNNGAQYPGGYPQQGYQQPPRGGYDSRYPNGYPGGDYPQQKPKKPSITDQITNYAKNLAQRVLTQTIIDKVSGRS